MKFLVDTKIIKKYSTVGDIFDDSISNLINDIKKETEDECRYNIRISLKGEKEKEHEYYLRKLDENTLNEIKEKMKSSYKVYIEFKIEMCEYKDF